MKKILCICIALICISSLGIAGCTGDTKTTNDVHQIFERMISGDQIAEYIPFGYDGLIAEYEFVDHVYHYGDDVPFVSVYRTALVYDTVEAATKRFSSLKRTYKDDCTQQGNTLFVNYSYYRSSLYLNGELTYDEHITDALENGFIFISPEQN
ncbi:MAG: hypothetical protein IKR78_05595 [Dehalococcoidales bacterium]|nr:hypothetical protein [Dehalococcoidales bacterium]